MLVLPWELQGQTMPNHFERQRQTTFAPHMWLKHFYTFLRSLCGFVHGTPIEWHCHYNNWKRLQMFAFPAHWWNQPLKPGFQHRNYNIYVANTKCGFQTAIFSSYWPYFGAVLFFQPASGSHCKPSLRPYLWSTWGCFNTWDPPNSIHFSIKNFWFIIILHHFTMW